MRKTHTRQCACDSCIETYLEYLDLQGQKAKRRGYKKPSRFLTACHNCKKVYFTHPSRALKCCSARCSAVVRFGATETTKTCKKCGTVKPRSEFYKTIGNERQSRCKKCSSEDDKAFIVAHPELQSRYHRVSEIRRRYRLEPEEYFEMLARQGGVCAICKTDKPSSRAKNFFVDHCHDTQVVRGLLCGRCNTGLGYFKDDPKLLATAVNYLTPRPELIKLAS